MGDGDIFVIGECPTDRGNNIPVDLVTAAAGGPQESCDNLYFLMGK